MKEEVIQFDDEFLLNDNEPFLKAISELDGEYEAKWYEPIFNTHLFVGVDYHFDFDKLLALFKDYEKKYSVEESLGDGTYYNSYKPTENGGVYSIDYSGLKYARINGVLNEDGTLTSNITVEAKGGKYDGWSGEKAVFVVMLFKYNDGCANTCNYAKFTTKEKLKEFFNDLQDCIVSVDKKELISRAADIRNDIIKSTNSLYNIQSILGIPNYVFIHKPWEIDKETGLFFDEIGNKWCIDWRVILKMRTKFRDENTNEEEQIAWEKSFYEKIYKETNGQREIEIYYSDWDSGLKPYVWLINTGENEYYLFDGCVFNHETHETNYIPGREGYNEYLKQEEVLKIMMKERPGDFLH